MPEPRGAEPVRPSLDHRWLRRVLLRLPPSPSRCWIAYSGGLDSRVLLHLCAQLQGQPGAPEFIAVHVHHGLQAAADAFAEHCRATCRREGIAFRLLRVDAQARQGQSREEAARTARYGALRSLLAADDVLLTAQHQDDQAETLLLQLLRGSGLAGLAAMPESAPFPPGRLLRPLLEFSRRELQAYGEAHTLQWIDDPSNLDLSFDRNFIRHRVLPLLAERWPAAAETLSRSARHCAEAQATLAGLAQDLLKAARHSDRPTLSVAKLRGYSEPDRRLVLREWLKAAGFRRPSARVLDQVVKEALTAGADRNPAIRWSEGEIRRYRGELYVLPPRRPFDASAVIAWDGGLPLRLPDDNGELAALEAEGIGIAPDLWRNGPITVRYRQGGEVLRPAGRDGSRELKKLFQEVGLPPWLRERVPLVYLDGRLAAVAGCWVAAEFAGSPEKRNLAVRWTPPEGFSAAKRPDAVMD
jgi:tRNA(Ile)-lysidine synthase